MTTPYAYSIRHKPTDTWYIGSRTAKGCNPDELLKKYFTSSKYVKELIEKDGIESFEIMGIKVFDIQKKALNCESLLHWIGEVDVNENCLNKHRAGTNFPPVGKSKSTEHIKKLRERMIEINLSEEHRKRLSEKFKGGWKSNVWEKFFRRTPTKTK